MRKLKAVADASVLIHLSAIGRFHLLLNLFEIVIPEGVYEEVVVEGWGLPGSLETVEAIRNGFITVERVIDMEKVRNISYEYGISISNAEVIQLAKEINAEIVLADEEEVREGAGDEGFDVRGCLGILIESVKRGLLKPEQAVRDVDGLVESGYRVSEEIVNEVKGILRGCE